MRPERGGSRGWHWERAAASGPADLMPSAVPAPPADVAGPSIDSKVLRIALAVLLPVPAHEVLAAG
jgi:hypothetical protein